jgi:hypothetical protein
LRSKKGSNNFSIQGRAWWTKFSNTLENEFIWITTYCWLYWEISSNGLLLIHTLIHLNKRAVIPSLLKKATYIWDKIRNPFQLGLKKILCNYDRFLIKFVGSSFIQQLFKQISHQKKKKISITATGDWLQSDHRFTIP